MYCYSFSCAIVGMEAVLIRVETDESSGLPFFQMVGFLSSEAKEAKDRVRIAIQNSGYLFPNRKVTVNLSPADIHKSGTGFDLAIACSLMSGMGYISQEELQKYIIIGELGLDGSIHGVTGVLPMVLKARESGFSNCIVPKENANEAALVEGVNVYPLTMLKEAVLFFELEDSVKKEQYLHLPEEKEKIEIEQRLDFSEVKGQQILKRAIEIAVAGMHNLLMVGPAGAGKSMIAKRIPGVMPELSKEEQIEVTKIYSIAGLLDQVYPLVTKRPFRSPHHSVTTTAMVGGGRNPKPGEVSLSDRGVLFLDELPEFPRNIIELLRQPLEDGIVTVSRLNSAYQFPTHFMLVCAMNPCLCGFYPDKNRCSCTAVQRKRYLDKVSRPFLDRIDMVAEAVEVSYEELMGGKKGTVKSSDDIRKNVLKARKIQEERFLGTGIHFNAQITEKGIHKYCSLQKAEEAFLEEYVKEKKLSPRACHRLLKVARTIADLEGSGEITAFHLKEAALYRNSIGKYWKEGGEIYG